VLAELLPAPVSCAESFTDPPDATLYPEEELAIANAVEKRRREFTTARHCARTALTRIGVAPAPLLPGDRGAPRWPPRVVGSITHCAGYRGAAVARDEQITAIGLDAEPNEPLPAGILTTIATAAERVQLAALPAGPPRVCWDRLLFSAKEAVYKAWYPLTHRPLGFEEAEIAVRPAGTFAARLLVPGPWVGGRRLTGFTGGWLARDGLVLTAIAVPVTSR
jgi:enterobactin synthetase component D / holo-[acyl-carrier protein] synthase